MECELWWQWPALMTLTALGAFAAFGVSVLVVNVFDKIARKLDAARFAKMKEEVRRRWQ